MSAYAIDLSSDAAYAAAVTISLRENVGPAVYGITHETDIFSACLGRLDNGASSWMDDICVPTDDSQTYVSIHLHNEGRSDPSSCRRKSKAEI